MDEPLARVALVLAVAVLALAWAGLSRRGVAWRRRRVEMPGLGPGTFLFTSRTCTSCAPARSVLAATGRPFEELAFEEHEELFRNHRIDRVPAVARLERDGRGWMAEGVPAPALLRRWLSGADGEEDP